MKKQSRKKHRVRRRPSSPSGHHLTMDHQHMFLNNHPEVPYVMKSLETSRKKARQQKVSDALAKHLTALARDGKIDDEERKTDEVMSHGQMETSFRSKKNYLDQHILESCSPGPKYQTKSSSFFNDTHSVSKFSTAPRFNYVSIEPHEKPRATKTGKRPRVEEDTNAATNKQIHAGIYMLRNIRTGHIYFGSSWDLNNARAQNFVALENGTHYNLAMIQTFQAYGAKNLRFHILERLSPAREFNFTEFEAALKCKLELHRMKYIQQQARFVFHRWQSNYFERYWPRWKRQCLYRQWQEQTSAAIEIQKIMRARKARKQARRLRRMNAARRIQSHIRRFLAQKLLKAKRQEKHEHVAASTIQRQWTRWCQSKKFWQRRRLMHQLLSIQSIQRVFRGHLGRTQTRNVRQMNILIQAAISIQSHVRRCIAIQRTTQRRMNLKMLRSALVCQSHVRRIRACGQVHQLRLVRRLTNQRETASSVIQRAHWQYQRRKLQWALAAYERQERSAVIICGMWRHYLGRKFRFLVLQICAWTHASLVLQRGFRHWQNRRRFRRDMAILRRHDAAVNIQRVVRGHAGRQRAHEMRRHRLEMSSAGCIQRTWRHYLAQKLRRLAQVHQTRSNAALVIQRQVRGMLGRRRFQRLRIKARQERAALAIQGQFRLYQARRRFQFCLYIQRTGPCVECREALAEVYSFYFELALCHACHDQVMNWKVLDSLNEEEENDDDDGDDFEHNLRNEMIQRVISYERFQQQSQHATLVQALYRGKVVRDVRQLGLCQEPQCQDPHPRAAEQAYQAYPRARKIYCHDCELAICHTCAEGLHGHRLFESHVRVSYRAYRRRHIAVVQIQAQTRRHLARNTLSRLRQGRQDRAARTIQVNWKYNQTRVRARVLRQARLVRQQYEQEAARTLQRWFRTCLRLQRLVRRVQIQESSALRIQCWTRQCRARELRTQKQQARKAQAAANIQRYWRTFFRRRKFRDMVKLEFDTSRVEKIQRVYRQYVARIKVLALREERERTLARTLAQMRNHELELAAVRVQGHYRRYRRARLLRQEQLAFAQMRRETARRLAQLAEFWHVCRLQRLVRRRRLDVLEPASVDIQRLVRGRILNPSRVARQMRERQARRIQRWIRECQAKAKRVRLQAQQLAQAQEHPDWIEYWDTASEHWYYYNAVTGESRWTLPNDEDEKNGVSPEEEEEEGVQSSAELKEEDVDGWVEYWDENHQAVYYYHLETGECTWENPHQNQEQDRQHDELPQEYGETYKEDMTYDYANDPVGDPAAHEEPEKTMVTYEEHEDDLTEFQVHENYNQNSYYDLYGVSATEEEVDYVDEEYDSYIDGYVRTTSDDYAEAGSYDNQEPYDYGTAIDTYVESPYDESYDNQEQYWEETEGDDTTNYEHPANNNDIQ